MNAKSQIKRIAVFVEHFPPFLGSDRTIFELARRIAEKGTEIHFIATQPLRYLLGKRPSKWKYIENWSKPPPQIHKNISLSYLLSPNRLRKLWKWFPPLAYLLTVIIFIGYSLRALTRFSPEIVITAHASPLLGIVSLISSKIMFRPLITGCPDWMTAYAAGLMNQSLQSLGPVLLQLIEITLYKWSDRIITATRFLENLLISYGIPEDKIVTISNGVDTDFFTPECETEEIKRKYRLRDRCVVLFSGHLEEWAGIKLVYDLAKHLDAEHPDSIILLVGQGDIVNEIFGNLVRNNLGHMLAHAGLQPFDEMPKFTAASDIALCLFPDTPVAHAASPLKLFEYLSAGRAVVATAVAGTLEILTEGGGILVPPDNSDIICNVVLDLCNNPEKRKELGEKARELVKEKYTWQRLSEKLFNVCLSLIGS